MLGLIQAEWLKLRKQSTAWIVLLIPVALVLIVQLGSILVVLLTKNLPNDSSSTPQQRAQLANTAQEVYNGTFLPDTFLLGLGVVGFVKGLLTIILMATMVGGEYSQNTWKNILIRYPYRHNFLLTKLLVGMFWLFVTLLAGGVAGVIFGFIPNLTLPLIKAGLKAPLQNNEDFLAKLNGAVVPTLIQMLIFAAITIALTIITRSTVGGLAITLVYTTLEGNIGIFVRELRDFTISANLTALTDHLEDNGRATIPLAQSLVALLIYMAIALGISIFLFRRADMAGV